MSPILLERNSSQVLFKNVSHFLEVIGNCKNTFWAEHKIERMSFASTLTNWLSHIFVWLIIPASSYKLKVFGRKEAEKFFQLF